MITSRRQPAEWAPHDAVWIGWPSAADLWEENLSPAQAEVARFAEAVTAPAGAAGPRGEVVILVYRGADARAAAEAARSVMTAPELVSLSEAPIGDVWLRDTGPIVAVNDSGDLVASAFRFNGWGGKYELPEDDRIADILAAQAELRLRRFDDFVGEGGAVEADGEGTLITTRQCLLNPNRNPGMSEKDVEGVLKAALGAEKVIWLDDGLDGDHTDGHVDNLARFVAPGRVVCMAPTGDNDPNAEVLNAIRRRLEKATDAAGRRLEVIAIPSPGLALMDGEPVPASHMNFYIANRSIVLPTYESLTGNAEAAAAAVAALMELGLRDHVIAIDSGRLLSGGGSFHCISQQRPQRP